MHPGLSLSLSVELIMVKNIISEFFMKFLILLSALFISSANASDYPVVKAQIIKETKLMTKEMKEQHPNTPVCMFARKDYDSQGFGITYRDGLKIKGQFGCVYYCGCQGKAYYVTHVYRDEYFDADVFSKATGGPKRAKWFICPHSVDENSWSPMRDELERIIGYNVSEDSSFFEPRQMSSIKELGAWENQKCR
jgi:hypothetical protein